MYAISVFSQLIVFTGKTIAKKVVEMSKPFMKSCVKGTAYVRSDENENEQRTNNDNSS